MNRKILALIIEDGGEIPVNMFCSISELLSKIARHNVETIVCGEMISGKLSWEKQFTAVDVMPSSMMAKEGVK